MAKWLHMTDFIDAHGRRVLKKTRPVRYVVYTGVVTDTEFEIEDAVQPFKVESKSCLLMA